MVPQPAPQINDEDQAGVQPGGGLRVVSEPGYAAEAAAVLRRAEAIYRHDRERAVAEVRRLLEIEYAHEWRLLRAAKLLLSAGETELARTTIARAATTGRHQQRAFTADLSHARGLLADQERSTREAERHLRSAHTSDPTYAVFAASVMEFLVAHRREDEARAFADRARHRLADRAYFDAVRRGLGI